MSNVIEGLEPTAIWQHFYNISQIPRGSKNEEQIAQYVMDVARKNGLEVKRDKAGNVVVLKPALSGFEKSLTIILQGHLDMVCEKNKSVVHDFTKDPIKLVGDGKFIKADGTTLGADNGIGVSTILAVMEDKNLAHGPLELLFTVDEETGLTGAKNLDPDMLKGRYMLNLDSEEEGILYIGCAGGKDCTITLPIQWESVPANYVKAELKAGGLLGGHSGADIHLQRGNSVKIITRVLWSLYREFKIRLSSLEAGNKRNAIPREAEAIVYVPKKYFDSVKKKVENLEKIIKSEFESVDKNLFIAFSESKGKKLKVLKKNSQEKLLNLLYALPHGVIKMSNDIPGLVETSTNLATVKIESKVTTIGTSQRSSADNERDEIVDRIVATSHLAGADAKPGEGYPGWKPNLNSRSLQVAKKVYEEMFGKKAEVKAIHAGLECGIIGEKFEGMDMVSFGPNVLSAHSPDERVDIASIKPTYNFLLGVLKALAMEK
jgi:dipeptidase D